MYALSSNELLPNYIQGIPAFCDFTIRDPCYIVILFQASILRIPLHFMILKKIIIIFFFSEFVFGFYV